MNDESKVEIPENQDLIERFVSLIKSDQSILTHNLSIFRKIPVVFRDFLNKYYTTQFESNNQLIIEEVKITETYKF